MKNNTLLIAAAVIAVIAIAAAAYLVFSAPAAVAEYNDPDEAQLAANTNLYAALLSGGLQEPFVDVSAAQAYVAYELPSGADSDTMQKFVLGAAAAAGKGSQKIVAVQYVSGTAKMMWAIATSDYDAWISGTLSDSAFDAKIEKKTP